MGRSLIFWWVAVYVVQLAVTAAGASLRLCRSCASESWSPVARRRAPSASRTSAPEWRDSRARCCVNPPWPHSALYEQCKLTAEEKVLSLNRLGCAEQEDDEPKDVREQVNRDLEERDHVPIMPQAAILTFRPLYPWDGIFADHNRCAVRWPNTWSTIIENATSRASIIA